MIRALPLLLVSLLCSGCVSNTRCPDLNGLKDIDGEGFVYQETSIFALHFAFGVLPLIGDATLANAVDEFTAAARAAGDTQIRIAQSGGDNFWWVLPPLSFLLTPVTVDIAGDVRP